MSTIIIPTNSTMYGYGLPAVLGHFQNHKAFSAEKAIPISLVEWGSMGYSWAKLDDMTKLLPFIVPTTANTYWLDESEYAAYNLRMRTRTKNFLIGVIVVPIVVLIIAALLGL